MSGVTKLTVIFDENDQKIAILSVYATKRHTFAVTLLIESPPKAEARRRNIRDTQTHREVRKCQVRCEKL